MIKNRALWNEWETAYIRSQQYAFIDAAPKKGPELSGENKAGTEHPMWPEKDLWGGR